MPVKQKDGTTKMIDQKVASAGTKSRIAAKHLTHQRYLDILNGAPDLEVQQTTIRAQDHRLYNLCQTRVALSAVDDKRFCLSDGTTRAHGHYKNYLDDAAMC